MISNFKTFIEKNKTFILVIVLLSLFYFQLKNREHFSGLYMIRPTKCFSCEKDLIKRKGEAWAWQGQVSKCFDCQTDLVKRLGPKFGGLGGNNKTF